MEKNSLFGLFEYSSINIGDEIQCIAATRFLPHIDVLIHRERTDEFLSDKRVKCIMNAWWMWEPKHFPPSECIDPLLISMHLSKKLRKYLTNKSSKEYLIKHGPVGCRDISTQNFLNKIGIPAYFSGCLTLTLNKNPNVKKQDYIITVDVPDSVHNEIKKRTTRPVYKVSRLAWPIHTEDERFRLARMFLTLYQGAHCIVTSRLHVAMPSLALGTPLMLLDSNDNILHRDGRYDGLMELCNCVKEDDFMSNPDIYNFDNPPQNPETYKELREQLIKKCSDFTGYNNSNTLFPDEIKPVELIELLEYRDKMAARFLYWSRSKDMVRTYFKKYLLGKTKHDLSYNVKENIQLINEDISKYI